MARRGDSYLPPYTLVSFTHSITSFWPAILAIVECTTLGERSCTGRYGQRRLRDGTCLSILRKKPCAWKSLAVVKTVHSRRLVGIRSEWTCLVRTEDEKRESIFSRDDGPLYKLTEGDTDREDQRRHGSSYLSRALGRKLRYSSKASNLQLPSIHVKVLCAIASTLVVNNITTTE